MVGLEDCGGNRSLCLERINVTYDCSFYSQRGEEHCEPRDGNEWAWITQSLRHTYQPLRGSLLQMKRSLLILRMIE